MKNNNKGHGMMGYHHQFFAKVKMQLPASCYDIIDKICEFKKGQFMYCWPTASKPDHANAAVKKFS